MQQETLHMERRLGIGGSDAGVIAGVDPYKTELELYYEKRGEIPPADLEDKEAIYWGRVLEDRIAEAYSERTGRKVRRVNRALKHKTHDWMIAHIDRDVVGEDRGLEVKNVGGYRLDQWGEADTDQVPERHLLQCQHYMAVREVGLWDLAALLHGNTLRVYTIERDEELIETLTALEGTFWKAVQDGTPPAADYNTRPWAYLDLMRKLYPGTNGQTIEIGPDRLPWHLVREQALEAQRRYDGVAKAATAHLLQSMGENAVMLLPDGRGYRRKLTKKKGYTVEPSQYMDMRLVRDPLGKSKQKEAGNGEDTEH